MCRQQRYTDKKEMKVFLIHKEIQNGAVEKSYMRRGFLIYKEMRKSYMRRPLVIYDFATAPFRISLYEENLIFYFIWCRYNNAYSATVQAVKVTAAKAVQIMKDREKSKTLICYMI
jgi:hypothetical protein